MTGEPLTGELRTTLVSALQRVPELAGRDLVLTTLSGGITNRNYRVDADGGLETPGGDTVVLRLGGNDTHLLGISREVEHAATVMAAGVGVGPEVAAYIRPEGYLVTRFIVGGPITDEAVHEPATIRRVADSIRRIHDGPAIPGIFVPYRIGEAYRALAASRGVPIPDAYAAGGGRRAARGAGLRGRAAAHAAVPQRPAERQLHRRRGPGPHRRLGVRGMGDPFFDLGNFSVNHGLDPDEDEVLLAAYEGSVRPERLGRLALMRVVSDFREATWGVLQQAISTLDVDFHAYAARHFDRLLSHACRAAFRARR